MFFVNKQQWHHFGKGTQCGTVLWEMLTKLFVRSYFQQNELLIYFFTFLWHKIIAHEYQICSYIHRLAIQNSLKCTGTFQIFIHPHWYLILDTELMLRSIELFIYIQTYMCLQKLTHIQLKNRLWTTVAFLHCCNLIWGLANNNYSLYFFSFWLTVAIYVCAIFSFPTVLYSYI